MSTTRVKEVAEDHIQPPFLRLPPSVRQRIYSCVGLVPTSSYDLPYVLQLNGSNRREYCCFHGLLVSCRTVYDEASVLLYRANRFVIRFDWKHFSLEPLRKLTESALSNLTNLKVVLNEASCHAHDSLHSWDSEGFAGREVNDDHEVTAKGVDGINSDARLGLLGHDEALSGGEWDEALFAEWESTIDLLSSRISPAALDLSVVCDVLHEEVDTAKRVIAPLARLPLLKNCHLRLSNLPSVELNRMAQDAALKACGRSYPQGPQLDSCSPAINSPPLTGSQLMELPLELRLLILEYTDLVTPWKEVTWRRQGGVFLASRALCTTLDFRGEECMVHHGCQFVDCWQTFPKTSIGCFCRLKHSAFSSHCKCWEPPTPLLLVCRTLYKEAQSVFFSRNRFVIHDFDCKDPLHAPAGRYTFLRLAASEFLNDAVPSDCLSQLRSLEFVFPPYDHDNWPQEGDVNLNKWRETLNRVKGSLNLPALTVRLVMANPSDWVIPASRRDVSQEEGEDILAGYNRILEPLVQLGGEGGLAEFHADFDWPWSRTNETLDAVLEHMWEWVEAKQRVLNEGAERLVLGDERYARQIRFGSRTGGSVDSVWVRKFTRDA